MLGRWSQCEPNPDASELTVGQEVRLNLRSRPEYGVQPVGTILDFRVENDEWCADVQWPEAVETVPRWALIKA